MFVELPAVFVDLLALFELGFAQCAQHLVMPPRLGAEFGDVTVGQRGERAS